MDKKLTPVQKIAISILLLYLILFTLGSFSFAFYYPFAHIGQDPQFTFFYLFSQTLRFSAFSSSLFRSSSAIRKSEVSQNWFCRWLLSSWFSRSKPFLMWVRTWALSRLKTAIPSVLLSLRSTTKLTHFFPQLSLKLNIS